MQGTTTKPLINLFHLGKITLFEKIMYLQAKLKAISKGRELVKDLKEQGYLSKITINDMEKNYKEANEKTKNELLKLQNDPECKSNTTRKIIWHQAISMELCAYQLLFDKGLISESVIRELKLNIELERDRLKQDIFPDLKVTAMPLEVKMKNKLANLLRLVMPKNKFINLLRQKSLSPKYEMTLAIVYANNHIKSTIGKIPQLSGNQKEIVEECRLFYKKRAELAIIQKKKLEKYIAIHNLQYQVLYRATINAELASIEEMSANSGIPDSVANILKSDIDNKIKKIARRDPNLSHLDLKV